MRRFITIMAALVMVAAMFQAGSVKAAAAKASSQSKSGAAVAYAKVSTHTQSIQTFGGKGTTGAVVTDGDVDDWVQVTFIGKYPKDITTDQVIVNVTAEANGDWAVANAQVYDANPTQLVVDVYSWISTNVDMYVGENMFISVFLGQ